LKEWEQALREGALARGDAVYVERRDTVERTNRKEGRVSMEEVQVMSYMSY